MSIFKCECNVYNTAAKTTGFAGNLPLLRLPYINLCNFVFPTPKNITRPPHPETNSPLFVNTVYVLRHSSIMQIIAS